MDDDRTGCTLPRSALVLVVPTAVVQTPGTTEEIRVPFRIVVHHHQDLASKILTLEIIPLVFGGLDAIADEDEFPLIDRDSRFWFPRDRNVVIEVFQGERIRIRLSLLRSEGPGLRRATADADHRDALAIGLRARDRLKAVNLELRLEVQLRDRIAHGARAATFEQIIGEELYMTCQCGCLDPRTHSIDRIGLAQRGWNWGGAQERSDCYEAKNQRSHRTPQLRQCQDESRNGEQTRRRITRCRREVRELSSFPK